MRASVRQFYSIARLTTLELTRQPLCLLLLTVGVVTIALMPLLITHSLGGADKLVRDSSLALHLTLGLVLGAQAACSTLVREIRRGTASSVLSKPIGRGTFFLAKFTGVATLMLLFSFAAGVATLLTTRSAMTYENLRAVDWWASAPLLVAVLLAYAYGAHVNYRRGRPFNSAAFGAMLTLLALAVPLAALVGPPGHEGHAAFGALPLKLVPASLLVTLAILVLSALAVSLAPRLDLVPTIAICAVVLLVGLMSDYLLGRPAEAGNAWAAIAYALVPNWQQFWMVDALSGERAITATYLLSAFAYATTYAAGLLTLGTLAFQRMEMK